MDATAVDEATSLFLGNHDFTSYCATATEVEDRVRTIFEAEWERNDETWIFRIRGSGFLQYMVRTIAGTLVDAGQRRIEVAAIARIFEARDRRQAGPSLPACGLHLISVRY